MSDLTLSEALTLFLLEDRARATRDTYRKVLQRAFAFFGPARLLTDITRQDILRYLSYLRDQSVRYADHPLRPAERGGLAPRTIEKHSRSLSTFFNWAVDQEYLQASPAARLKLRRYQRPPGSSKAATPEELKAILEVAEAKAKLGKILHLAIFLFLCDTGARAGEAASLTLDDLNLETFTAQSIGKGDKMRPLFFGRRTATVLQTLLDQRSEDDPDDRLFGMTADSLSQVIYRMAKRAGIKHPIGSHAIRHRVGQVWSGARLSEQATQMKLGHDDPAVTIEMYYNTTWDYIRETSLELELASIYGIPAEPKRLQSSSGGNVVPYQKTG